MVLSNQLDKILLQLETSPLDLNISQCLGLRHKDASCQLCQEVCPQEAIEKDSQSFSENFLQVNTTKCNGCGFCSNVCPTGVFELKSFSNYTSLLLLKDYLQNNSILEFGCFNLVENYRKGNQTISLFQVPCLGELSEGILLAAAVISEKPVWLNQSLCKECELEKGLALVQKSAKNVNQILNLWQRSEKIFFIPQKPPSRRKKIKPVLSPPGKASNSYSRRGFFDYLKQETRKTAFLLLEKDSDKRAEEPNFKNLLSKRPLSSDIPPKQKILLKYINELEKSAKKNNQHVISKEAYNLPFASLKINEDCSFCQGCFLLCPTGALTKSEKDKKIDIQFQIACCTNCGLCKKICLSQAIELLPQVSLDKLFDPNPEKLISFNSSICDKCRKTFVLNNDKDCYLCPSCKKEEELEDAFFQMLEIS